MINFLYLLNFLFSKSESGFKYTFLVLMLIGALEGVAVYISNGRSLVTNICLLINPFGTLFVSMFRLVTDS